MRGPALLLIVFLAACAPSTAAAPSLGRRAAEAIDPRAPIPEGPVQGEPSAELVRQLESLIAQAVAGDERFRAAARTAERLAAAAGPAQSESWIAAQQALSAAVAERAPVTRAMAEIDAIGARRIQQSGGIGAADLAAVQAAAQRVGEIDRSEAAIVDRIQAMLAR